jgi:hypothetical protein
LDLCFVAEALQALSGMSYVIEQFIAFGSQNVKCPHKELLGPQNARGLDCADEMILALAQLQMVSPFILPRQPPHLNSSLFINRTALLCTAL